MAVRILHVVGGMSRAGAETWLMHVLRRIDRKQFRMDFLVHTRRETAYDAEVRALGSRIIPCLDPSRPCRYAPQFRRVLAECGPYDVVHSHLHHFNGIVLRLAAGCVPVRIAHSHLDTSRLDCRSPWPRKAYLRLCERWIHRYATLRLACSRDAAACLYGPAWKQDPRVQILPCGLDLDPFSELPDRRTVRAGLGIPADALVLGHVGRFCEQKNHTFLLDVAAEVLCRQPKAMLLLVGEGPLQEPLREKARRLGILEKIVFAGSRGDVPSLMLGAMDVFVFPSLYEGLGLVAVEAQAAGLPCILSASVPQEADVMPRLVRRVSLAASPAAWADAVLACRGGASREEREAALAEVRRSSFNIQSSLSRLESLYGPSLPSGFHSRRNMPARVHP
jgi:glycosyltransferase involved in cell wall biosynthesis